MKSEAEWKAILTPHQFQILRLKGTERAFTGETWDNHRPGRYHCAGCDAHLYDATAKFDSGCGWPSFTAPATGEAVAYHEDRSLFMSRVEVTCRACGGHLGHVFDDGPLPTRKRHCINSGSMTFRADTDAG